MLYWLLFEKLFPYYGPARLFGYVTFRTAFASLTALFISLWLGPWLIRKLREFQIGQHIHEDVTGHQKKAGTPTMGGLLIIISIVVPTLLWANLTNPYIWIALFGLVSFGAIGFYDDFTKVKKMRNLGLTARRKLLFQVVCSVSIGVMLLALHARGGYSTTMNIPFFKTFKPDLLISDWLSNPLTYPFAFAFFFLFLVIVLAGSSNAVNLTDGLDGLATGLMIIAAGAMTVLTYLSGHREFATYLDIVRLAGASELTIFCGAMTGASLGFLWYNAHPAEVFMGDVGALALGGAMGTVAVLIKQEALLLFIGGVYVMELMSVVLQVGSYKLRKKRIFRMAPLHHHFELLGWHESKVIIRFWIMGLIMALFALTTLKLRLMHSYRNQEVLVVGAGKSGLAAARFLRERGARVVISDNRRPATDPGFPVIGQDEAASDGFDLLIQSPGVPLELPIFERARARGARIIGELELAADELLGHIIGVTGANGKTTTTALIGHIFQQAGRHTLVGGNIGVPVTELVAASRPDSWAILEISSFQLETVQNFRAAIALVLNITPDHLDRHFTMERYIAAKARLVETQTADGVTVLNAAEPNARGLAARTAAKVVWFNLDAPSASGVTSAEGHLWLGEAKWMPLTDIPLPGRHNVENVMAAAAAAWIAGIAPAVIAEAVRSFPGVEHRIEFVRELDGVRYFNDSKATNVDAAEKALAAFPGGLWMILGGKDKHSDYRPLAPLLEAKAKGTLLIGAAAPIIRQQILEVTASLPLTDCDTLDVAIRTARRLAAPGDIVLLSPACASFDQYQSYEHRGRSFKELVRSL